MSLNRTAARVSPLLRGATRIRRSPHSLPRSLPAVAILLPYRSLATETTTSTGPNTNFPPPGFNTEQAKKPLASEQSNEKQGKPGADAKANKSAQDAASKEQEGATLEDVRVPRNAATSHPKTDAVEARALAELAAEKHSADVLAEEKGVTKKEDEKKLTLWQKVKHEAAHYWDGTKLLAMEVRISTKLALKMAAGYELTRRENRQVCRMRQ